MKIKFQTYRFLIRKIYLIFINKFLLIAGILIFFHCYPEYRVPFNAFFVDIKHTSRGENNTYYPSRSDQNANVIGPGRLLKKGKSCSSSISYIEYYFFIKGGSIREAANSAGIEKIAAVEYTFLSIFGVYIQECILVW